MIPVGNFWIISKDGICLCMVGGGEFLVSGDFRLFLFMLVVVGLSLSSL